MDPLAGSDLEPTKGSPRMPPPLVAPTKFASASVFEGNLPSSLSISSPPLAVAEGTFKKQLSVDAALAFDSNPLRPAMPRAASTTMTMARSPSSRQVDDRMSKLKERFAQIASIVDDDDVPDLAPTPKTPHYAPGTFKSTAAPVNGTGGNNNGEGAMPVASSAIPTNKKTGASRQWGRLRKSIVMISPPIANDSLNQPLLDIQEARPSSANSDDSSARLIARQDSNGSSAYAHNMINPHEQQLSEIALQEQSFEDYWSNFTVPAPEISPLDVEIGMFDPPTIPAYTATFAEASEPLSMGVTRVPESVVAAHRTEMERQLARNRQDVVDKVKAKEMDVTWREHLARLRVEEKELKAKERLAHEKDKFVAFALAKERGLLNDFKVARETLETQLQRQNAIASERFGELVTSEESMGRKLEIFSELIPTPIEIRVHFMRAVKTKLNKGAYCIMVSQHESLGGKPLWWSRLGPYGIGPDYPSITKPVKHYGKYYNRLMRFEDSVFLACPPKALLRPNYVIVVEIFQLANRSNPVDHCVGWTAFPMCNEHFGVVSGRLRLPVVRGEHSPHCQSFRGMEEAIGADLNNWLCNIYIDVRHLSRSILDPSFEKGQFSLEYDYLKKSAAALKIGKLLRSNNNNNNNNSNNNNIKVEKFDLSAPSFDLNGESNMRTSGVTDLTSKGVLFHTEGKESADKALFRRPNRQQSQSQQLNDQHTQQSISAIYRSHSQLFSDDNDNDVSEEEKTHGNAVWKMWSSVMRFGRRVIASSGIQNGRYEPLQDDIETSLRAVQPKVLIKPMPKHVVKVQSTASGINNNSTDIFVAISESDDDNNNLYSKYGSSPESPKKGGKNNSKVLGFSDDVIEQEFSATDPAIFVGLNKRASDNKAFLREDSSKMPAILSIASVGGGQHSNGHNEKTVASDRSLSSSQRMKKMPEIFERGYDSDDDFFLDEEQKGRLIGADSVADADARHWAASRHEGEVIRRLKSDGVRLDDEALEIGEPLMDSDESNHGNQKTQRKKKESPNIPSKFQNTWASLEKEEEIDTFSMAIAADPSKRRRLLPRAIAKSKLVFINMELFGDLLPSHWGSMDFYITVSLYVCALWIRIYIHYLSEYLFLEAAATPVYDYNPYIYQLSFKYMSAAIAASTEVGVVAIGPLCNIVFFLFLSQMGRLFYKLAGSLPLNCSKFIAAYGVATALDPFLVALVDVILHNYNCSEKDALCHESYTSSMCKCFEGDMVKLWNRYEKDEGSGITGLFITAMIYAGTLCVSLLLLYEYIVYIHRDARILDMWRRINAPAEEFLIPDDFEISAEELLSICSTARKHRGLDGSTRRVQVTTHYDEVEKGLFSDKATQHYTIYNYDANGHKGSLYRHFVVTDDGAIIEIFEQYHSSAANKLEESLESSHGSFKVKSSRRLIQQVLMKDTEHEVNASIGHRHHDDSGGESSSGDEAVSSSGGGSSKGSFKKGNGSHKGSFSHFDGLENT